MRRSRHYSALCKAPELVFQEGSALSRLVLAQCPALLQPYCPTFWATNAHAQTVLCGALASTAYLQLHSSMASCSRCAADKGT